MRASDIRRLLKAEPFNPIQLGLSDGRSVVIRHPDQAVVSQRKLFVGLAKVQRSRPMATPRSGDTIARDWLFIDLLHIVTVEPVNDSKRRGKRTSRR